MPSSFRSSAAVALLWAISSVAPVAAQEEFIVGDDTVVVSEDTESSARAIAIAPREVDGRLAFHRQSSDAFVDPDDRLNLQPKYYFELSEEATSEIVGPHLGRATSQRPIQQLALANDFKSEQVELSDEQRGWFPLTAEQAGERNVLWEWLDYQADPSAKLVVMCLPTDEGAVLHVMTGEQQQSGWLLQRQLAARTIPRDELPQHASPRDILDTWDRPKSLGPKAAFFGRIIALLKQVDQRHAIDFYGEALHADSDCRLWLPPLEGRPITLRFIDLPIIKDDGQVAPVTVIGVTYENEAGEPHSIALDYPLCSPPLLEQLRRLAASRGPATGDQAAGPDLAKLIGADVLDEFARRLVAGTYR